MSDPSPAPVRRVFLHIGLHKTGTSYLQNTFRANVSGLRDQGVFFPAERRHPVQSLAVADLMGRRPRGTTDARIAGAWQAAVDAVNSTDAPTILLSDEHLSLATTRQVRRAVQAFAGAQVHVVVTARDLARVLVSAWQEEVKNRGSWSWAEFSAAVKDPTAASRNPARAFWIRQDLPAVLATWQAALPVERIHVVTVPPAGTPSAMLLQRFGSVVGFDPLQLSEPARWSNETIGLAGTEVIRRLNERLADLNQRQYDRVMKLTIVRILGRETDPIRFTLPEEDFGWVRERGLAMIEAVRERGYPVAGDLDELVPLPAAGRRPDDAREAELLEAALAALAGLSQRYATAWWASKDPDDQLSADSPKVQLASGARAAVFRGQRAAARYADRSPVAGKAMAGYLRLRAAAREHSAGRAQRH
jgi:hypothetical protein